MFLVIVINIFLMLLVSVMMEYNNLAQRLSLLENNISLALDRSIEASTASEELFTAAYQEELVSHGLTGGSETGAVTSSSKMPLGANMTLWGGSGWYDASSYILNMVVYQQPQRSITNTNKEIMLWAVATKNF